MIDYIEENKNIGLTESSELETYLVELANKMHVFVGIDTEGNQRRFRFSETVLLPIVGRVLRALQKTETARKFIKATADWQENGEKIPNFASISECDIIFVPIGGIALVKGREQELVDLLLNTKENIINADKPTIVGDFEIDGVIKHGKVLQVTVAPWMEGVVGQRQMLNQIEGSLADLMEAMPALFDDLMQCTDIYAVESHEGQIEEDASLRVKNGYKGMDNFRMVINETKAHKTLREVMDAYDNHFKSEKTQKVVEQLSTLSKAICGVEGFDESIKRNRSEFEALARLKIAKTNMDNPEQIMLEVMQEHMREIKDTITRK